MSPYFTYKGIASDSELFERGWSDRGTDQPQFEAGREKVGKKGVVREKSTHYEVIEMVLSYALSIGFSVLNLDFSPIKDRKEYRISCALQKTEQTDTIEHVRLTGSRIVENAFSTLAK